MYFYIRTFGCQMNENDSLLMAGLLTSAGHQAVERAEDADIILVNTCCVRENAENRALGYLGSLKGLCEIRPRIIVASGCMTQQQGVAERLRKSYRQVSIIIGTFAAARLPHYIQEYAATGRPVIDVEERYDNQEPRRTAEAEISYKAQVNINYGCNNFCSYCIVPYVRGRERSRQPIEIIQEIQDLAGRGVKEVQLLGQNVNSYGKDFSCGQVDFAGLLTAVNDIEGLVRIRYMTSHPRDFDAHLAQRIAELPKVCRHFHLPVQSGCDRLLALMNRGYTTEQYFRLLTLIRSLFPQATMTTDLIVGFPGEREEDFQQTLDFVAACGFDSAYTFLYSRRGGTPAADMPDQVDEQVKKERLQRLLALQDPISLRLNQVLVGATQQVMVEGESRTDPAMMSGRTEGNKIVIFPAQPQLAPGSLTDMMITEAHTWNLLGRPANV